MESGSRATEDKDEIGQGIEPATGDDAKDALKPAESLPAGHSPELDVADPNAQKAPESDDVVGGKGSGGETNMEASISTIDDVIRAGGYGARDDISSFLPVASDSTDFEAAIRDARNYEEPVGEFHRYGLGWDKSRD
ncbi:hypothetical protein SAY87_023945 [Trapa incisa]|uniref:Uncharacterized protein n=1 Tax=Trapa incisa TaxID=236973 RepID=A0AAN7QQS3_9MYRT|nr:hypothetical protein SAY87_023945 [Trapa incisa]